VPMLSILDMIATSLVVSVAFRTGKIIKNGIRVVERKEYFLTLSVYVMSNV